MRFRSYDVISSLDTSDLFDCFELAFCIEWRMGKNRLDPEAWRQADKDKRTAQAALICGIVLECMRMKEYARVSVSDSGGISIDWPNGRLGLDDGKLTDSDFETALGEIVSVSMTVLQQLMCNDGHTGEYFLSHREQWCALMNAGNREALEAEAQKHSKDIVQRFIDRHRRRCERLAAGLPEYDNTGIDDLEVE